MKWIPQIIGLLAVATFLLSYQQKKRKNIILLNVTSRALYILQYLLLGAFEGAVLDVVGILASLLAQNKDRPIIKKHIRLYFVLANVIIILPGLLIYEDVFSLFPIAGALLHTGAFWLTNEKHIRRVSFIGSPFWMVYNLSQMAYSSSLGDFLSMVSIGTAMWRYDRKRKPKKEEKL